MTPRARYSAFLNVLFPGLGHVYIGEYSRGLALFVAFVLLLSMPFTRFCIPLLGIYAGWESFKRAGGKDRDSILSSKAEEVAYLKESFPRARLPLYLLVGALGATCWLLALYPFSGDAGRSGRAAEQARGLSQKIRACENETGVLPPTLENCIQPEEAAHLRTDPWGQAYLYEPIDGGFEIRSKGPDLRSRTADDLIYIF